MTSRTRFVELKRVFARLHAEDGCPWDRQQTTRSLLPYLREEVAEFVREVRRNDAEGMREELGDILLHVMFYSQIAERAGTFTIEDVIAGLIAKLKRRHPHVFGQGKARSVAQIVRTWERIKKTERCRRAPPAARIKKRPV